MPKYDVRLQIEDAQHDIRLEVYQRVISDTPRSDDEIVQQATLQFKSWAEERGADWQAIAMRVPHASISEKEIVVAS